MNSTTSASERGAVLSNTWKRNSSGTASSASANHQPMRTKVSLRMMRHRSSPVAQQVAAGFFNRKVSHAREGDDADVGQHQGHQKRQRAVAGPLRAQQPPDDGGKQEMA